MAAKNRQQAVSKPAQKKKDSSAWIVPAVVAVICAGIFYWAMYGGGAPPESAAFSAPAGQPTAAPAANFDVPAHYESAEAAQPYPQTLDPKQFQYPTVVRAYAVAREIPGVLAQQPCYCHCDQSIGHRGLLDCWTGMHGSECSVCIQEALLTDRLTKAGRTPAQIREAIIAGEWRNVALN
jgi:hypothetical protein